MPLLSSVLLTSYRSPGTLLTYLFELFFLFFFKLRYSLRILSVPMLVLFILHYRSPSEIPETLPTLHPTFTALNKHSTDLIFSTFSALSGGGCRVIVDSPLKSPPQKENKCVFPIIPPNSPAVLILAFQGPFLIVDT